MCGCTPEPRLHRLLGQQAGGQQHAGVAGVGAAGDGGNQHVAIAHRRVGPWWAAWWWPGQGMAVARRRLLSISATKARRAQRGRWALRPHPSVTTLSRDGCGTACSKLRRAVEAAFVPPAC